MKNEKLIQDICKEVKETSIFIHSVQPSQSHERILLNQQIIMSAMSEILKQLDKEKPDIGFSSLFDRN